MSVEEEGESGAGLDESERDGGRQGCRLHPPPHFTSGRQAGPGQGPVHLYLGWAKPTQADTTFLLAALQGPQGL